MEVFSSEAKVSAITRFSWPKTIILYALGKNGNNRYHFFPNLYVIRRNIIPPATLRTESFC